MQSHVSRKPTHFILTLLLLLSSVPAWADSYPLRAKYRDVPFTTTGELRAQYGVSLIVDVRSQFEFEVIHIRGAKHIAMAKPSFAEELAQAAVDFDGKNSPVVFYCNGITCEKSYKAARKAIELGYTHASAYDAGIFNWTKAYPALSVLLGESPVDPDKVIPGAKLKEHMLGAQAFIEGAGQPDVILIDARDAFQREEQENPAFAKDAKRWPMNSLVKNLNQASFKKKTLYIFDAVGKQVRWLQYHLEANGYDAYFFLLDGAGGL